MLKVTVALTGKEPVLVEEYVIDCRGDLTVIDGIVFIHAVAREAIIPVASIYSINIWEVQV